MIPATNWKDAGMSPDLTHMHQCACMRLIRIQNCDMNLGKEMN